MRREFRIRANDGVALSLGAPLLELVAQEAPGVRLRLLPEGEEDPADLRTHVDLDVGELPDPLPHDVRASTLREHRMVAVARAGAEFAGAPLTPERFAALPHITVTRRGRAHSVVDEHLAGLGLRRDVLATAPPSALPASSSCAPTPWRSSRRRSRGGGTLDAAGGAGDSAGPAGVLVGPGMARTAGHGSGAPVAAGRAGAGGRGGQARHRKLILSLMRSDALTGSLCTFTLTIIG
ncbi:LysR substrate-binding domain-containing protein [Streptomyces mirabilis]|nr:LysR substrate-binding domain-containing protein [Streptomyces mirabilis]